jgi:hypothetical protein
MPATNDAHNATIPRDGAEQQSPHHESAGPLARLGRIPRRACAVGLACSLLIHLVLLFVAGVILLDRPGAGGDADAIELELAIATQAELQDLSEQTVSADDPLDDADVRMADALPTPDLPMPALDASPSDTSSALDALGGAAEGLGDDAIPTGGAGGVASFFGVEARGQRFAYIVDRSGSMEGAKIQTLKSQLISSIGGLSESASFMVFFYSSGARSLGNRSRWLDADPRNRDLASREIAATSAHGGTDPLPAFELAFNMRPKPDAIYFMTDGVFDEAVAAEIAALNARTGAVTPVHAISLVDDSARELLQSIARQSGGTYTHVGGGLP